MAPVDDLPEIKTARQIASELVRLGVVDEEQADRVITVHSMSKTDCLAGARLAVVEIRDQQLRQRFEELNSIIQPNLAAIFICYLFYRSTTAGGTNLLALAQCHFPRTDTSLADRRRKSAAGSQSVWPGHHPADRKHVSSAAD